MYQSLLNENRPNLEALMSHFRDEIANIRTGRATPAIVEGIMVSAYGAKAMLKEVASIASPDSRNLTIQPWDKSLMGPIQEALVSSDLGVNPVVQGELIRLSFPPLTEERRKDFIKLLKQKSEEIRIKIRRIREDIWRDLQQLEKEGQIREDDKFRAKDELQKVIDEYMEKLKLIESKKETELLTV
ncbi:MAG: ribosome recycling factor [Candidatus Yanofskybacteria bacterium CG10_big_fil_rev_8_21_14_0_10_46_23]|uniref:Ribosome-recycling factor n=1 Tax=Candidatus Yanofskybacteria bacterium CG10_big_fil_rev_8_21_14_0_10_46_23 TaxID=1975098 RepID=A0A2H0R5W7_9BACT|nr:MAG: ribosome recycling factor [Candidatus Yanofskybacteria bacterium CG10_big_fil_rev_8_21_14_0_10_46_23]